MKQFRTFVRLAIVLGYLSSLFIAPLAPAAHAGSPQTTANVSAAMPNAQVAPVEFMSNVLDAGVIAANDQWMIAGGYLYWAKCEYIIASNSQSTDVVTTAGLVGYLRRWPIRGGTVTTLASAPFCNATSWAADDSGLYYWQDGFIYRREMSNPLTPVAVAAVAGVSGALVVDGKDLFYIANNNGIYRTPKGQTYALGSDETKYIADGGAGATSLIVNSSTLTFSGGGAIKSVDKTCIQNCVVNNLASEAGAYLSNATVGSFLVTNSTNPLWVNPPTTTANQFYAGNLIRGYRCSLLIGGSSCGGRTVYTAPQRPNSTNTLQDATIGPLASDGNYLFWVENLKNCSTGGFGYVCYPSDQGRLMKYHIGRSLIGSSDPFDTPQPIATMNSSGTFSINGTPLVSVADGWVYFTTSQGLSRIRADAPPVSWDLAFSSWEVTQGIQNLANDVPLIANRPTYVRVYGTKLNGPIANNVEAILVGTTGGGAALGSLRALNGVQNFSANNAPRNRAVANEGWLFQLPNSWTNAGATKLTLKIDPRGIWNDPNRGNNNSEQSFTFIRKAPVCIVTIPVRSHGPAASNTSPNLFFARRMLQRLWPVSDVWLYHQDSDIAELQARWGIPPWEYGPYEIPDDSWKMLLSLTARDLTSDDPDECDNAGARTFYTGIVSPQTPTGDANPDLGTNGTGRLGYDQAWVKLPKDDFAANDWQTVRAATLAHELGHNQDRNHVNCGGPADPDAGYPYKDADGQSCTIDNRDQSQVSTYFGFDTVNQKPIVPNTVRDLMAYGTNRWISDYTYRALMNGIKNRTAALEQAAVLQAAPAAALAAAQRVVLVTGVVSTTLGTGELQYGWVYPTTTLGQSQLQKWQAHVAATAGASTQQAGANYHLRLLDTNNAVLADQVVTLASSDGEDNQPGSGGHNDVQTFAVTFPAPDGQVARLELLKDSTVLASLQPGSQAPTVSVLSPAGGETVDTSLTLSWRSSDPDPNDKLLFNVQYSPDNGQHWRALLSNFPHRSGSDTVTLDLKSLDGIPASTTGGLIRVAASDGYHTTLATSKPFTVVNRAPQPYIDVPGSAVLPAGQTVVLEGGAFDAEEGALSGAALRWALNGTEVGQGQSQTLEGLAAGSYTLTLTARDAAGKEATASQTLTIAPLAIAKATPTFDGDCNDDAYTNAARVGLAPYADGSQTFVSFVRSDDALYACFSGMMRSAAGSPGTQAVVRVDSDYGRRTAPGANDHIFVTDESGMITTLNGNGSAYAAWNGGAAAQISANGTSWNAELRIDAGAIGGMNHVIGLSVDQARVATADDHFSWPHRATLVNPSSWSAAALGDVAQISTVTPASVPVGTGDTAVTVEGSGFASGAVLRFEGTALATNVISSTQLQATIPAAKLATAGTFALTAVNPGLEAAPTNALPFAVTNPLPQLSQATLAGTILRLSGSNFAPGATVQFNGVDYPATSNGSQLQITLPSAALAESDDRSVSVSNPSPGGGVSNVLTLQQTAPASLMLYLPLVRR